MIRANTVIKVYVSLVSVVSVVSLIYVYAKPPESMRVDGEGVPHFTPDVMHPETGEAIPMGSLIKHFRGD